jgi:hypothetical protein
MIQGTRCPVLKMEWVEASSLISFIEGNLRDLPSLARLAESFATMTSELAEVSIVHGDLQHGNLLVTPSGELKLIDYDGMFVPGLAPLGACEIGHANYQSPAKTMSTWGPYLDHFSAWINYGSLLALSFDPGLWQLLREAFNAFSHSAQPALRAVGAALDALWTHDLTAIPPLNPALLPEPPVTSSPPGRQTPDQTPEAQPVAATNHPDSSWVTGHLPPLPPVPFSPPRQVGRLLASVTTLFALAAVAAIVAGLLPYLAGGTAVLMAAVFFAVSTVMFRRLNGSARTRKSPCPASIAPSRGTPPARRPSSTPRKPISTTAKRRPPKRSARTPRRPAPRSKPSSASSPPTWPGRSRPSTSNGSSFKSTNRKNSASRWSTCSSSTYGPFSPGSA